MKRLLIEKRGAIVQALFAASAILALTWAFGGNAGITAAVVAGIAQGRHSRRWSCLVR